MGYDTKYEGVLYFNRELLASDLAYLERYLGESLLEHPEWVADPIPAVDTQFDYIDLQLTEDFDGIEWNGAEKTDRMHDAINFIIYKMRDRIPSFSLEGHMIVQGEDPEDRWIIEMGEDDYVHKVKKEPDGRIVTCPQCTYKFIVEEEFLEEEGD